MAIWYHLGRKKGDFGQVWLALSILCWSCSGAVEIYLSQESNVLQMNGWRSIFSLLNSLFILLALPWFKHSPVWLASILKHKSWYFIVGLPFLFSLLPTISKMINGQQGTMIMELDVYYSILTLILLAFILWESFFQRGLQLLGYLSFIFVLFTIITQLYKFTEELSILILFSSIFKSSLIMIFFALALSWVKDLANTLRMESSSMWFKLSKHKQSSGKLKYTLYISGIDGREEKQISLSQTNARLLKAFAIAKTESPDEGWLEIKPKGGGIKDAYPIKDYNEIKRLTLSILDGAFGKGAWDRDRHELPFKEAFFEFSKDKGRQIRIKISAHNIELDL